MLAGGTNLHRKQEVATRFIPRFYYQGPFTPVAEEEKEDAGNSTGMAAPTSAAGVAGQGSRSGAVPLSQPKSGRFGASPHSPIASPAVKEKIDFLETSTTLLGARRQRAHAESGHDSTASAAAAASPYDNGLTDEVHMDERLNTATLLGAGFVRAQSTCPLLPQ